METLISVFMCCNSFWCFWYWQCRRIRYMWFPIPTFVNIHSPSSVTISHVLKNENDELCFLASSYLCWSNYDRKKKYSHLAVPDNCTFFSGCKLEFDQGTEEPAKKYSNDPAKTIQHCNQWPDDCTFFSGRNLINEPAETIQAHGTPKDSNSQKTICRVKIRTPPITL